MLASFPIALALLAGSWADEVPPRPFLHPLFTDHVVLQRDISVPVWGWTEPGQRVKVGFTNQVVETTANADGNWMVKLGPYPAGGPHVLTVRGPKSVEIKDVLIGDVWLSSGQSNMEWVLANANNPKEEIAAANYPTIRLFTVPKKIAYEPMSTVDASWQVCSPSTAGGFSAVSYFFGRELNRELNVPIGLINSSWGGTVAEAWTSAGALETMPDFKAAVSRVQDMKANTSKPAMSFEKAMNTWWNKNDSGSSDQPGWFDPKFDANAWKVMNLPGHWEQKGMGGFDGIVWFRKEVDLPATWEGQELTLSLGAIDDRDTTFVNGVEVGQMSEYNANRRYKVPAGLAKTGRNLIAVRVLDTAGLGGFSGPPEEMKLALAADKSVASIALTGDWLYKESKTMVSLTTPPAVAGENPNVVTVLHNGMIAPLKHFPIKGAIWYQGEGNVGRASQYRKLLPTMIQDWRSMFGVGEFPFYIVQLANFLEVKPEPMNSSWAELRESQYLTTKALPNVGLALAIDIGDAADIHPRNKQDVGRRLALNALASTYGKPIEFSGPVFKSKEIQGNTIKLSFDHVGGGLVAKGNGKLEGFAIAGDTGAYVWAEAVIEGDTIVVKSPTVDKPVNVRYAWADNPICNLTNKAGLPAVPFRTDPPRD